MHTENINVCGKHSKMLWTPYIILCIPCQLTWFSDLFWMSSALYLLRNAKTCKNSLFHSRWLQKRPIAGHSWVCQLSWWCLWKNVFKKGQNGAWQFWETGGKGKKIWEITIKTPRSEKKKGEDVFQEPELFMCSPWRPWWSKLSLQNTQDNARAVKLQPVEDPTWKQVLKDLWTIEMSPCWNNSWRTEACIKHTHCSKREV